MLNALGEVPSRRRRFYALLRAEMRRRARLILFAQDDVGQYPLGEVGFLDAGSMVEFTWEGNPRYVRAKHQR
jgi:hypothetical protein